MKRTILTVAAVILLAVTGTKAKNSMDSYGFAPPVATSKSGEINSFCKAILKGDIETVKSLIALGENVNQKSLGMTPAIFAARYNRAEILQLLIENGADLNIRSDKGYTAKKQAEISNAKEALAVIESSLKG